MALVDETSGAGAAGHPEPDGGQMSLFEHLSELRRRLIVSILAIVVGGIVAWFLYNPLLHFMAEPYAQLLKTHPRLDLTHGQLVITALAEGFTTRLKISAYVGIALATPVVLWELWRFITPGLHKNEKRYIVPFVASAAVLFAMGVAAAVLVFPKAIGWLISVSGTSVAPLVSASSYVNLYALMCLIFGLAFLYPVVVMFLMIAGVVPSARWRKWRRVAIIVIAAVAAVVTPSSDPFSFMAMAVPMYVFYEASIGVGRILGK
ncbi:MAG: twin-arginine translocase subunit TatC [Acidimicrobiales bacterium]